MLIKKKHMAQQPLPDAPQRPNLPSNSGPGKAPTDDAFWQDLDFDQHAQTSSSKDDEEASVDWTKTSIDMGLVPERRSQERRLGFRRADDRELLSRAELEAEKICQQAQEAGFQHGLEHSEKHLLQLQEQLKAVLSGKEEALLGISNDIALLAVEIAERILKTEISCDDTLVNQLVRDVIHKAGKQHKRIVVKVHPENVKSVRAEFEAHPIPYYQGEFNVEDDEAISPGSCVVETSSGMIDANFETQLSVLRKLFGL